MDLSSLKVGGESILDHRGNINGRALKNLLSELLMGIA